MVYLLAPFKCIAFVAHIYCYQWPDSPSEKHIKCTVSKWKVEDLKFYSSLPLTLADIIDNLNSDQYYTY